MRKVPLLLYSISVHIASIAYAVSLPSRLLPSITCAKLVRNEWVSPAEARACMYEISFQDDKRKNVRD